MKVRGLFHAARAHTGDRRIQRGTSKSVATVTVAALTAAGIGLAALPASAAMGHLGPGVEVSGVLSTGNAWLGAVEGTAEAQASGWLSWCITAGYDAPSGAGYTAIDYVDDALLAAMIATHERDGTELSRAAISYLVHTRHETGTASVSAASRIAAFEANTPQAVKDQAAAFLTEAAAVAGPYTADAGTSEYVAAQRTGVITVHPVVSSNGTPLVGYPMTVTLNGPAVFDETGTKTWTGTTPSGDMRLAWSWDNTTSGEVTWDYSYSGLPRRTLTKLSASGQVQDTLTYGLRAPSDPEEITVPGTPFEVVGDFQPVAVSNVDDYKVVDQGEALGDTLTVSAADDPWVEINGDPVDVLFEGEYIAVGDVPVANPSATVPADAQVLATAQIVADGPGTYSVEVAEVSADPGMGTWVWSEIKSHQPASVQPYIRGDWSDQFGLADETTSVRRKVEVDSDLSIRETKSGIYLVDDIWADGFADGHGSFTGGAGFGADEAKMTHTAYFFPVGLDVTDENLPQATELAAVKTAAENGFYASIGSTKWKLLLDESGAKLPGTYVVVSSHPGDDRTEPFTSSVTDTAEQFVVLPEPLEVTTQIQTDREVVDGADVSFTDDSTLTGTVPEGGVSVVNDLYAWESSGDPVCTEDSLVAAGDPIAVTAAGTVTSKPVTVTVQGGWSYGYVETTTNDAGQVVSRGECGAASETVHVPVVPADEDVAEAAADQALAVTGSQVAGAAVVALALLVAGVGVVAYRRRTAAHLAERDATDSI